MFVIRARTATYARRLQITLSYSSDPSLATRSNGPSYDDKERATHRRNNSTDPYRYGWPRPFARDPNG